jgi:hypothetical protein
VLTSTWKVTIHQRLECKRDGPGQGNTSLADSRQREKGDFVSRAQHVSHQCSGQQARKGGRLVNAAGVCESITKKVRKLKSICSCSKGPRIFTTNLGVNSRKVSAIPTAHGRNDNLLAWGASAVLHILQVLSQPPWKNTFIEVPYGCTLQLYLTAVPTGTRLSLLKM